MKEAAAWWSEIGGGEGTWLLVGKGPSFERRGDFDLSGYVRFWLTSAEKVTGNLRVQVDIDPMSFY